MSTLGWNQFVTKIEVNYCTLDFVCPLLGAWECLQTTGTCLSWYVLRSVRLLEQLDPEFVSNFLECANCVFHKDFPWQNTSQNWERQFLAKFLLDCAEICTASQSFWAKKYFTKCFVFLLFSAVIPFAKTAFPSRAISRVWGLDSIRAAVDRNDYVGALLIAHSCNASQEPLLFHLLD